MHIRSLKLAVSPIVRTLRTLQTLQMTAGWLAVLAVAQAGPAWPEAQRWTPAGPGGGSLSALAVDPRNALTLYGWSSGIVVSHDGGASWQARNVGAEGRRIAAMAVDPDDSRRIFAAATGPAAVLRSDDGGDHWTLLPEPLFPPGSSDPQFIDSLLALPAGVVLVGREMTVLRSQDGGETWRKVYVAPANVGFHTLAADPGDPRVVYAASYGTHAEGSLLKSLDGGLTWTQLPDALAANIAFALAPSQPRTLYESGFLAEDQTWRSRDGGATWEGPFPFAAAQLLVDPRDPCTVYGGGIEGFFRSRDCGETWQELGPGLPPLALGVTSYYGINTLAAGGDGAILAATPQGLMRSRDFGASWRVLSPRGFHGNPVSILIEDPFDPAHRLLKSFDFLVETRDGWNTFSSAEGALSGRQISALAFDPSTPQRLLAVASGLHGGAGYDVYESRHGSSAWADLGPAPYAAHALALLSPGAWLAAAPAGLYRSTDGGVTWQPVALGASFFVSSLVADPHRRNVAWALGLSTGTSAGPVLEVYRSDDSGASWSLWATGYTALLPDPRRPGIVWLAGNTFAVTRDDGRTFEQVGTITDIQEPGISSLLFLPGGSPAGRWLAGTAATYSTATGILESLDGGVTWQPFNAGFPTTGPANVAALLPDGNVSGRVWAALLGGGLWERDLDPPEN